MGTSRGSRSDTRWVGEIRHFVEVTPKEDEAGPNAEEHQGSPKADIVKGLPHTYPVRHFLQKVGYKPKSLKR